MRVRDPESPIRGAYQGTPTWEPDSAWLLQARFVADPTPQALVLPNVMGTTFEAERHGVLVFERGDQRHALIVSGRSDDMLVVIFSDLSNGNGSYAGGRFLEVPVPVEGEGTLIDFNRAYNPPCAYSPFTTCPLPPRGNQLPFEVRAGEQAWPGAQEHW